MLVKPVVCDCIHKIAFRIVNISMKHLCNTFNQNYYKPASLGLRSSPSEPEFSPRSFLLDQVLAEKDSTKSITLLDDRNVY